jgi:cobaltochelatase CobT subunit
VVQASELAEKGELLKLYNYVSNFSAALKQINDSTLASRLIDYRKTGRGIPLAVSILIDNSGSMRGDKIVHTAAWCLIIIEWMDRLGIPIEILGFTTRAWKGGQSRELWLADKKPAQPGRLNDLRHLIYKSFSMTAEVSAPNFGLMMREGLLKENIDGEALLWASARLEKQPARNKVLFVFSDGAPVDDSTLSTNPGDFLEKHLRAVVAELSKELTLYAVGIGHDVSRYYPNSLVAEEASSLGLRFFDILVKDPVFLEFWKIEVRKRSIRKRKLA